MPQTTSQQQQGGRRPGATTSQQQQQQGGRRPGAGNYSKAELSLLLDVLEEKLPIGPDQWADIVNTHVANGYPGRDVDSIRRKYSTLHRKSSPTGDPDMPPEVRQAKRIKFKEIGEKANIGDAGQDQAYDLEEGGSTTNSSTTQNNQREPAFLLLGQPTQLFQTQTKTQTQDLQLLASTAATAGGHKRRQQDNPPLLSLPRRLNFVLPFEEVPLPPVVLLLLRLHLLPVVILVLLL